MAKLIDHKRRTVTHGAPATLAGHMITDCLGTPHARRIARNGSAAAIRYATLLTVATIRRNGRTAGGLQLQLTDDEREAWEAAHPLPED